MVSFKYIADGFKTIAIIGLLTFTAYPYYKEFNNISIEKNNYSTVMIANKMSKTDPKTGEKHSGFMIGAGILVNNEYVLTVNHLAIPPDEKQPDDISIKTIDGVEHAADISSVADGSIDLMLLKLKTPLKNGVYPKFACSVPQVGTSLYTIGNPEGFERMIQYGQVSIQKIPDETIDPNHYVIYMSLFHGNSGGPVFGVTTGVVVGIIDAIQYWKDEFGRHPSPVSYIESPQDMCAFMDQHKINYNKA